MREEKIIIIVFIIMVSAFIYIIVAASFGQEPKPITAQEMPDGYICFRIEDNALSCLKRNR